MENTCNSRMMVQARSLQIIVGVHHFMMKLGMMLLPQVSHV